LNSGVNRRRWPMSHLLGGYRAPFRGVRQTRASSLSSLDCRVMCREDRCQFSRTIKKLEFYASLGWSRAVRRADFNMAEAHVPSACEAISTATILREVLRQRRLRHMTRSPGRGPGEQRAHYHEPQRGAQRLRSHRHRGER
jgi:hypothetical protein